MRPNKLIMSAFCPYSDEIEINFDEFGGGGLFLLTGETGAGKTTIFDGISYALYGEVSGENRDTDMLRSDFAKPDVPTFVKLVFEHKGRSYEIMRNPKYNRPAKRGTGFTTQNQDATINMPNGKVITGTNNVTEEVTNILGITHQQFKQIAMIAQGEFMKLLHANSKDRGEIFRKIFGTELYQRIQSELKIKANRLKDQLDEINSAILIYYKSIIIDPENDNNQRYLDLKDTVYGVAEMMDLLTNYIEACCATKEEVENEEKSVLEQIDLLTKELAIAEQVNQLIDQLEKESQKLEHLSNQQSDINQLKITIETSQKALYQVKPLFTEYKRLKNQCIDLEERIKQSINFLEINEPIKALKEQELIKLKSEEGIREQLATEINRIEESLPKYKALGQKFIELKKVTEEKELVSETILKLNENIESCQNRIIKINSELEGLKNIESDIIQLGNHKERLLKEQEQLSALKEGLDECHKLDESLVRQQEEFKTLEGQYFKEKEKYNNSEQLFYAEQAGILAETLEENQPCPVCGSLSHPQKAIKTEGAPTQDQLNSEKKALEAIQNKWQKASERCKAISVERDTKKAQLNKSALLLFPDREVEQPILEKELVSYQKSIDEEITETEVLLENTIKKSEQKFALEQEKTKTKMIREEDGLKLEKEKETLKLLEVSLSEHKTVIENIKSGLQYENEETALSEIKQKKSVLQDMKNKLQLIQQEYQAINDLINETRAIQKTNRENLEQVSKSLVEAKNTYEEKRGLCGFATEECFTEALIEETIIKDLETKISDYNLEVERTKATLTQLQEQTKDKVKIDLTELSKEHQNLKTQQLQIKETLQNIEHSIKNNKTVLNNLELKSQEREEIEKLYGDIKLLSETANGDLKGKQKLAFEQYVQVVYFNMVLNEANKRFGKMTANRFSLIHKEEGSIQSKTGLEIDVIDHWTNKQRSVKSLSGGESFKASLALALGLSDVVQSFSGGIQLDTMFIDEGFGSLDSESLEKAIDILIELTEGNRLVGIISHVEELKEKLDRKIIITKDRQGSKISIEA